MHTNSENIYLLFSADYELYFGENWFSEREVLIEPTEQILRSFSQRGIPLTIFADVASVWRYRSLEITSDYTSLFENQLREAIRCRHDVQLHLHPHWITSTFDGMKWNMDESKFKLSDLGYNSKEGFESADQLILRGKKYLEELLQSVDPSYRCLAFRAGGFALQPNEKELLRSLLSAGFKIDSSIAPGMFFKSNVNEIDYRKVPSRLNYRIGPRYGIEREDTFGIFEIPICTHLRSFRETVWEGLRIFRALTLRLKGKSLGQLNSYPKRGKAIQSYTHLGRFAWFFRAPALFLLELSGPYLDPKRVVKEARRIIESHIGEAKDLYFCALMHPKNVFPSTIQAIVEFWETLRREYCKKIKAITFQEAAKLIERNNSDHSENLSV